MADANTPTKPTDQKDVSQLTGQEMGTETVRIGDQLKKVAAAIRSAVGPEFFAGKTDEEVIKYVSAKTPSFRNPVEQIIHPLDTRPAGSPIHAATAKLTAQVDGTTETLAQLADDYQALVQRQKDITAKSTANPSLNKDIQTGAAQANQQLNLGSADPVAAFTPLSLNDAQIQDLARTGKFDITPDSIANMFPSAAVQGAKAAAQAQGLPDPTTFLDQLAPQQYQDMGFVHVGTNMPFNASDRYNEETANKIAQVKAQGLPAWEEGAMIDEINKGTSAGAPMTQDDYDKARQAILAQGLPRATEGQRLTDLAKQYQDSQVTGDQGSTSLRDVINRPYSWTADQVAATAVEMFKAGYINIPGYDPTKSLSSQMHITSAFDPDFQKAYLAWVSDSFKDRSKSMMDILQSKQDDFLPQLKLMADKIEAAKPKLHITLADPQGIRQSAEQYAQQTIGRRLSDDEYQQLTSYIQGLQTQTQTAAFNQQYGDNATGGTTTDVDVNARLEAAIKANHPVEAAAKDVADEAGLMRSMFAGPVQ